MEFVGKVALVTGGSSGIGRATALPREAARSAFSVGIGRRSQGVCREVREGGGRAHPLVADVASENDMQGAVEKLVAEFGRLDFLFANAGINGVWALIDEIMPDEWDRTVATNLRGTYLTLHYGVPHLKRAGGGAVVITASANGTRIFSNAGATAYSSTKAAQVAMTQMLALELAKFRIRVNVVCPGAIETAIAESTPRRHQEVAEEPVEFSEG